MDLCPKCGKLTTRGPNHLCVDCKKQSVSHKHTPETKLLLAEKAKSQYHHPKTHYYCEVCGVEISPHCKRCHKHKSSNTWKDRTIEWTDDRKLAASDRCIERWSNPGEHSKHSEFLKHWWMQNRERMCEIHKKSWLDPIKVEKRQQMWSETMKQKGNSAFTSKPELELFEYIKDHTEYDVVPRNRSFIGKELDILIPEVNTAVEFNGLWWHSYNLFKKRGFTFREYCEYHQQKRILCQEKGIRLITIDEIDYKDRPEVFRSFILNSINPKSRIPARKCEVDLISDSLYKEFLTQYHLNGSRGASVKLGLSYKGDLLAVAGFAVHKKYGWECVRLAFKSGVEVVGGWSKIQSHFGHSFLHYVNLNFFPGENRTGCGWRFSNSSGSRVYHRNNLWSSNGSLQRVIGAQYDPELTDFDNCLNSGLICIVDQGNDIRVY
jgi:hypothetical protein